MAKNEKVLTPKKQKVRKVLSIIANVIGVIVVIVTLLVSILTITRTKEKSGVASIFGYALMPVLTDSMVPEFNPGDLIITKEYKGNGDDLNVGDIITFKMYINAIPVYNTHRIYEKNVDVDGFYWFKTRGDNNPDEDHDGEPDVDYITRTPSEIVAVYHGNHIAGVGQAITKLQTDSKFYFLVVVTPLIVLFVIYVFFFVRSVLQMKIQKTREEAIQAASTSVQLNGGISQAPAKVSLDEMSDDEKLQLLLELQAKKLAAKNATLKEEDKSVSNESTADTINEKVDSDLQKTETVKKVTKKPTAKKENTADNVSEKADSDLQKTETVKKVTKKPTVKKENSADIDSEKADSDLQKTETVKKVTKKPTVKKESTADIVSNEKVDSDLQKTETVKKVTKKPTVKKEDTIDAKKEKPGSDL